MVDLPSDDRIIFASMVSALGEATQTMAKVAAASAEQHAWIKGHEAICDMREKATQRSLEAMASAVQRLADTVQKNADVASADRAALSKRIAEEAEARRAEIVAENKRRKEEIVAAEDKREARMWRFVGAIFSLLAIAVTIVLAYR